MHFRTKVLVTALMTLLPLMTFLTLHSTQNVEARPGDIVSYSVRGSSDIFRIDPLGTTRIVTLQCTTTINHHTLTITSAQLKALHTTPVTIWAAPGALKDETLIGGVIAHFRYPASGGIQYTGGGNTVIQYHTGPVVATGTFANTIIQAAASSEVILVPIAALPTVNDALEITTSGSDFAAGNGTLILDWDSRNN